MESDMFSVMVAPHYQGGVEMLGDLIYEEKGTTTGVRVLESENGCAKVEV